jgi:hypothetical protein
MNSQGWHTQLATHVAHGDYRSPQYHLADGCSHTLPDIRADKDGYSVFVEVKRKAKLTHYRRRGVYQFGIESRHWEDYCELRRKTRIPVWILVLVLGTLFGASLHALAECHRHRGVSYFDADQLHELAPLPLLPGSSSLAELEHCGGREIVPEW